MYGGFQRGSESCKSLGKSSSHHMQSVSHLALTKNTVAVAGDSHSALDSFITTSTTGGSFFKDGRKISIGDCALFKTFTDSPPSIGLIRWALSEENKLQLGVNWLYRSSELKLRKGPLVDSAPNEIFYSFHKDKITAASLLHPCKVAFLPRGVELPTETSSYVCRRVYDIANGSLRWLTDEDYINDQQQEVNQLLQKTRSEMHVTLHSGGRSPKLANGPTSTSQLKPASDSGPSSGTSFPSQNRGRKRERVDHGADPVKRERSSRTDGGDSSQCRIDNLKYEIAQITEKGGVVDVEGVEKLVQLMQPGHTDRKMDLVRRVMLVSVMASTDKDDCLNRFVQIKGLPILDEWLQDLHKGKIGEGNLKDCDKSLEEFILVLLRALDKLPVDLHALQMCNIGRSVNHLRSHKNIEIQKKARTLVDTWKKRVEAEMMSADEKSTSVWPSKPRLPETPHGGSRISSGSDVAMKSSISQNSASKTTSLRSSHGESSIKNITSSPGPAKPALSLASDKDSQPRNSVDGTADAPQNREDRSSSSNQTHNYGRSSSSKENIRSSASGSANVNKISNSTCNKKVSSFPGISLTGSQQEASCSKSSSVLKSTALEKLSPSASNCERVVDGHIIDGNGHKLIVKIPSRVRSPAKGSVEDPTFMSSRASSPVLKHEQSGDVSKDKSDTYRCNAAVIMNVLQNNGQKDTLTGSEGAGSPAADEEQNVTSENSKRIIEVPNTSQSKCANFHSSSFSLMNALIESCAVYSKATSSLSLEDAAGMNLLASVAAAEISQSNVASPTNSTERSIPAIEEVCNNGEGKSKSFPENCASGDCKKHAVSEHFFCSTNELHLSKHVLLEFSGERKCSPSHSCEDVPAGEDIKNFGLLSTDLGSKPNPTCEVNGKPNEKTDDSSQALPISMEKVRDGESDKGIHDGKSTSSNVIADGISNCRSVGIEVMGTKEDDGVNSFNTDCKPIVEVEGSIPLDEGDCTNSVNENLNGTSSLQRTLSDGTVNCEFLERANIEKLTRNECGKKPVSGAGDPVKVIEHNNMCNENCMSKCEQLNCDDEVDRNGVGNRGAAVAYPTSHGLNSHEKANVEKPEILEHISPPESRCTISIDHEGQKEADLAGSESASIHPDQADNCGSPPSSSASVATDRSAKMMFDLNEDFIADDGKCGESITKESATSPTICMINSRPFSVNSITSGQSCSVTAAAAAKGPFVPPEDLLRCIMELGSKESAATSAFQPAEPRKAAEIPPSATNLSCPDASTTKPERISFDIDLNVPDDGVLEEMAYQGSSLAVGPSNSVNNCAAVLNEPSNSMPVRGSGILGLDLNRVDETNEIGLCSASSNCNREASVVHVKPNGLPNGLHVLRDFDLNNGPVVDEAVPDQISIKQPIKGVIPPQLPSASIGMNIPGVGSFTSWFPPGSTYPTVTIPSMLPDRVEQSFPVFPPAAPQRMYSSAGVAPFNTDVYRGSASSSPAVPFASGPFQLPAFPFGTTYPLPSATFSAGATSYPDASSGARLFAPPINSQYLEQLGSFASQFQRPYMVNLPNNSNKGGLESSRKLGRQGLDLNAGPGAMESEVREETMPLSFGQHSVANLQTLREEHARMFPTTGSFLKRKEPEGSWDNETFRYKQSPWQ